MNHKMLLEARKHPHVPGPNPRLPKPNLNVWHNRAARRAGAANSGLYVPGNVADIVNHR